MMMSLVSFQSIDPYSALHHKCVVSELSGHALNLQLVIAGVWCSMAWSQREQVIHWESVWIFLTYKKYIWIEADCNIRFDAV